MRGLFLFLIMITIVMLGVAGCPKKDGGDSGVKPATPATNGDTSSESATDTGE